MEGNYRHHYLLAPVPTAAQANSRQQQQSTASDLEGLPAVGGGSRANRYSQDYSHTNYQPNRQQQQQQQQHQQQQVAADQQQANIHPSRYNANRFEQHHQPPPQQQQQQQQQQQSYKQQMPRATLDRDYSGTSAIPIDLVGQQQQQLRTKQASIISNNNHHKFPQPQDDDKYLINEHQRHQENYASQLRSSQFQYRFQQRQPSDSHFSSAAQMQSYGLAGCSSSSSSQGRPLPARPQVDGTSSKSGQPETPSSSNQQQLTNKNSPTSKEVHVNFNRSNQASGANDEDEGNTRKKKYLTAKYGQQQMNLIKKRLKIEMWLYEQLQELARGTKSEDESDEVDVDLDVLLDMDDDDTRRRWLKKTLEPFDDVPSDRIDKFIDEVLEQSKLL